MPLPDTLPPETWHRIIEVGEFFDHELKAMLAVAPQTTAKGMHRAAFHALFKTMSIRPYDTVDLFRLTFRLYTYTKLESLPLRSAVRNVHIVIFKDTDIDDTDDIAYPLAKTKFRDVLSDVLMSLRNVIKVHWVDYLPIENRLWSSIQTLPQLAELSLRGQVLQCSLDLRTAVGLRTLTIDRCQFNLPDAEPWIISNARLHHLSIDGCLENPHTTATMGAGPFSTNIFSAINLSYISTFFLRLQNWNPGNSLYPFSQQSQWGARSGLGKGDGLGRCLSSLTLFDIDYEMAVALGDADVFPSLRSCCLMFSKSQTALSRIQTSVNLVCTFLSRQTSLEVLKFGISWRDDEYKAIETYDLALCLGNREKISRLKKLRALRVMGLKFFIDLIPPSLANVEILFIDAKRSIPITPEVAVALSICLQEYAALRLFTLLIPLDADNSTVIASRIKQFAPQVEFVDINYSRFWLQSNSGLLEKVDYGHPTNSTVKELYQKYQCLGT